MKATSIHRSAAAAVALLLMASGAHAGQRRVTVGFGGNNFAPTTQTLNFGDHVTFVWAGGGHTATNGTNTDPAIDPEYAQIFDSGFLNGANNAFTWKCDEVVNVPYLCTPHFSAGMIGTLQISVSGVQVSSFRITEVQYNAAGNLDRIEIANLGGDVGDLGRYRIAVNGTTSQVIPTNSILVLSGSNPGRVVIHTNESGTNTPTDIYLNAIGDLPATGSVALYVPNTSTSGAGSTSPASLVDPDQIIDFVQWGAGNQANSGTAVLAGVWPSAAEFVPAVPLVGDYDLAFCGAESQRGASFWNVAHPNFRTQALCATPTQATTWGRIKVLYR